MPLLMRGSSQVTCCGQKKVCGVFAVRTGVSVGLRVNVYVSVLALLRPVSLGRFLARFLFRDLLVYWYHWLFDYLG